MKILRSIHSADPATGGTIESVRVLSQALIELGHEVELVSCDNPQAPFLEAFPLTIHACGPGTPGYGSSKLMDTWLEKNLPLYDLVIIEGLWLYNGLGVHRALRRLGLKAPPYYIYPHGMLDPWFKAKYPLKHLKKFAYWLLFERKLLNQARRVIFTTEDERKRGQHTFPGLQCRASIAPLGIAEPPGLPKDNRASFYQAFPELEGQQLLLFLGRLHEKKGLDLLLQAYAQRQKQSEIKLIIAGSGAGPEELPRWQALARKLGISQQVYFTGHLAGPVKWGALSAADAFILPSHQENFGMAVVEALASGTPVLISQRVNIWHDVASAGAGLTGPDTQAGTQALVDDWLTMHEKARLAMAHSARQLYERNFSAKAAAQRLANLLEASD